MTRAAATAAAPRRRPRLLHVFATFAVGGPQMRATQLMNAWGADFEHGIVASDDRHDALALIDSGVDARVLSDYPPMKGLGLARTLRRTGAYLRRGGWDLLLTYNWGAIETALANRLLARLPHVHHEEGFGPDEPGGVHPRRALFRRLALGGRTTLAVPSQTMVEVARRQWGFVPPKVVSLPNGVDLALYANGPPRPDVFAPALVKQAGQTWLGCISGLRPEKNVRRLVRVAAPLLRRPGHDVHVVICGTGAEAAAIEQDARQLGVADRIHLMGFQRDPHRYVGLFDVLVIPSDTEQFPICQVEAMAAGCAVAGTDVGDVRRILPPVSQTCVVPLADEPALTRVLGELVDNPARRQALGEANRAHVAAHYGLDDVARRYRELFGRVLQGG